MSLEDRLRHTLRRVEPDTDLAAAVLARLAAPQKDVRTPVARQLPRWALAASLLLAVGVGLFAQHERARSRNESAGRQLAYALELTSRELQNVHQYLYRPLEETGS